MDLSGSSRREGEDEAEVQGSQDAVGVALAVLGSTFY
jgi:hypothetical protein